MTQPGVRFIAFLCALALLAPQVARGDATSPRTGVPNADAVIGGMVDRTLPGGHAVFDGNTNLRKPSAAESADRLRAFSDFQYGLQSRQVVPAGRALDGNNRAQVDAVQTRVAAVAREIHLRGANRDRVARWALAISPLFRYEDQLRKQRIAANLRVGKPVLLMPGDTVSFQLSGFCMDHNLGTATQNEPMALRPLADLMPNELQMIFIATIQYGQRHPEVPLQALVWFFRGLGSSPIGPADFPLYASIVNAAYPGGWNAVVAWNNEQVERRNRKSSITNLATSLLRRTGLQTTVNSATDTYARLAQTAANLQTLRQNLQADITRIQSTPVQGAVPTDLSGFSRTSNGLDAVAQSGSSPNASTSVQATNGWLQTTGVMRNDTLHAVVLDPAAPLIAQAERPTQRNIGVPRYGIGYDSVSPRLQGAVDADINDDAFGLSKDLHKSIDDLLGTAADLCTIMGLPAIKACIKSTTTTARRKVVDAVIGIANVLKIATTGRDLRDESAPPMEEFTDKLIVFGGAFAAVLALPALVPAGIAIAEGATLAAALDIAVPAELADAAIAVSGTTAEGCEMTGVAAGAWDVANHSDGLAMWNAFSILSP